jgi:hypothetical protein
MKKFITILAVLFMSTSPLMAQDGELLDTESGPAPGDVPVDGGISLLLAAGVAYGASRWKKAKENE